MARPSFQFYPDDWMNDLRLRLCSPATRGIWMDMLCLMHQGEPYGHLAAAGAGLNVRTVANRCHVTVKQLGIALCELETHGVLSKTSEGVIFNRRMVRDEYKRTVRGKGGPLSLNNPNVPRPKDTLKDTFTDAREGPTQEDVVVLSSFQSTSVLGKTSTGELRYVAADLNGQTSQKFLEWWELWSKVRGTFKKSAACQAYISVVSVELEPECFACTASYLAGLETPNRGYNPDNFLFEMARDGFQARWPERKKTRAEALDALLSEDGNGQ